MVNKASYATCRENSVLYRYINYLIKKRGNKYENHSFASENFCIFASKIQ